MKVEFFWEKTKNIQRCLIFFVYNYLVGFGKRKKIIAYDLNYKVQILLRRRFTTHNSKAKHVLFGNSPKMYLKVLNSS